MSTEAVADDVHREKYAQLEELFRTTQQDCSELSDRHATVVQQLDRIRRENDYLLDQLSQYNASDFESDQSDFEGEDLLEKLTPAAPHGKAKVARKRVTTPKASPISKKPKGA
ncbi:hypothetical protein Poli38472_002685 [Pythium oligandrum]|uniref:Uncharacterized protein n=1 Tax=Pythium oligandrum TaxID=41045 RepID=A0A8K1CHM3_PYTOL|nr:hypothetical protein Poli38472_002685 [Pythium oligandrum]|eukprot:TMW63744.1 hypothetical protein Poli38472_002685 [Pythium oligandrum]